MVRLPMYTSLCFLLVIIAELPDIACETAHDIERDIQHNVMRYVSVPVLTQAPGIQVLRQTPMVG